ncbi:hypothetical protein MRX96_018557 [Rhipicephalus microplus]
MRARNPEHRAKTQSWSPLRTKEEIENEETTGTRRNEETTTGPSVVFTEPRHDLRATKRRQGAVGGYYPASARALADDRPRETPNGGLQTVHLIDQCPHLPPSQ